MSSIDAVFGGSLSADSILISGTTGTGALTLSNQSVTPAVPAAGTNDVYFSAVGDITLLDSTGFTKSIAIPVASNRIYTVPDVGINANFIMSEGGQTINGTKTFTAAIVSPNLTGTNTGDVTLGVVGATPSPSAASLAGQVLTLQPADSTHPGVLTAGAQIIGGTKTFSSTISASNLSGVNSGDVSIAVVGGTSSANGATLAGQAITLTPADGTNPGLLTASAQVIGGAKTFALAISAPNIAGSNTGDVTLTTVGVTPSLSAASLSGQALTLQPADGTHPGVLTAGIQTIGGAKTFASTISASNLSGTNSGDVSIATVGVSSSANGATLAGQAITLTPADGTNPGLLTASAQTIGGAKTFALAISAPNITGSNSGDVTLSVIGGTPSAEGASLSGQVLTLQPADGSFGGVVTTGIQVLAGQKTFVDDITAQSNINLPQTTDTTGIITMNGATYIHSHGDSTNVFVGSGAGNLTLVGDTTTCVGQGAGAALTSGGLNTLIGTNAGGALTSGIANIFVGNSAGVNIDTTSNNICIGNDGVLGDIGTLRLGGTQSMTFVSGIYGNVQSGPEMVTITSDGRLGSQTLAGGGVTTIGAISGVSDPNGATITGVTLNLTAADATNGGVLSNGTQSIAGDKTFTGVLAASNLSGTNTGDITLGTVGALPVAEGATLFGQVLTLQPADSSNPGVVSTVAQTYGGVKTFSNDINANSNVNLPTTSATVGSINVNGTRFIHGYGLNNVYVGESAGNYTVTGANNVCVGRDVGIALTSGSNNTLVGYTAGDSITSGGANTCIGHTAGSSLTTSGFNVLIGYNAGTLATIGNNCMVGYNAGSVVSTGPLNTIIGNSSGAALTTGSQNIFVGFQAGNSITTTGSNICIGSVGVVADAGVIRIGTGAQHTSAFVQGIYGVTPSLSPQMATVGTDGQLGSQAIPVGGATTVGAISGTSTANGASITGSTLNLAVADGTNGGVVSTGAQNIAGIKTFINDINANSNVVLPATNGTGTAGVVRLGGSPWLSAFGTNNSFIGSGSGNFTLSGTSNVVVGASSGTSLTSGVSNIIIGQGSGTNITTSLNNIVIGQSKGNTLVGGTGGNIVIGADVATASEAATIRIGTAQTATFVQGIYGVSPALPQMVVIASNGQLGSQAITSGGATTVGVISGTSTANGASITGNTLNLAVADATNGGVVSNSAQSFLGVKTFVNDITASSNVNLPVTTATTGAAGVVNVGGTRFISSVGTGNTFVGLGSGNFTLLGTGNTVVGAGSGVGLTTIAGVNNTIIGQATGVALSTGASCTLIGRGAGGAITTGNSNTIVGTGSGTGITTTSSITICGQGSGTGVALSGVSTIIVGQGSGNALTTGTNNVILGTASANALTTSSNNIIIGTNTGTVLATGTGGNILINSAAGSATEALTTRIGTSQTSAFMAGISSYNNANTTYNLVTIDQAGSRLGADLMNTAQLYTQTGLPANTTAMSVRGVSTTTYAPSYVRIGKIVMVTFPQILLDAVTQTQIVLTNGTIPAGFRPVNALGVPFACINNSVNFSTQTFYWNVTATGSVIIKAPNGSTLTGTFGPVDDIFMTWFCA